MNIWTSVFRKGLMLLAMAAVAGPCAAQDIGGFQSYLFSLRDKARAEGISNRTFDAIVPTLVYSDTVVSIDRRAAGGSTDPNRPIPRFTGSDEHRAIAGKTEQGRSISVRLRPQFTRIERATGVPASVILAIYGKESNYGSYTGSFDTMSALASLAYEGRRRTLFEPELIAAMKMVENGVPRQRLTGSFAGAMGKPQFLPSVYLRLAVDGDGDGSADIWASEADAMASIANYLEKAGWRADIPWGAPVAVSASLDRRSIANKTVPTRCPRVFDRHSRWMTMAEWRALGVYPLAGSRIADDTLATFLEPDGAGQRAYLLTNNYRVILDYNCSNFYALSVGLLADEISR